VDVLRDAFRTEERGIDVRSGLAGAAAAIGPLVVGLAIDEPIPGVVAAIGGLNVALCIPRAGLKPRLWWAGICGLGGAGALVVADAGSRSEVALVLLTLAWVAAWSLFRAAGPVGALLGFAVSAMLVIYAGLPITGPLDRRLLWYALGALPGGVLMLLARAGRGGSIPGRRELVHAVHESALLWHVVRLSVATAAGTALYLAADLPHGYWVPLTTLAVLQPTARSTQIRSVQRAAGTLVAGALVAAVTAVTSHHWPLVACAAASAFFLYALRERGYFWLVVLLTPTALFMLSAVDFQGGEVAFDRVADSMIGIIVGLAFGELGGLLGN
jgi:Fusaric acid resistance protein-like